MEGSAMFEHHREYASGAAVVRYFLHRLFLTFTITVFVVGGLLRTEVVRTERPTMAQLNGARGTHIDLSQREAPIAWLEANHQD